MISYEKALDIILDSALYLGDERVDFTDSLDRVLAEDVYSDVDMPPFDKAAMDGFACRREDLSAELEVIETIAAGQIPEKSVGPGQCARIMTGAMIPEGADTVIMVEQTEETGTERIRFTAEKTAPNIARMAEDVKVGDVMWQKGQPIKPSHIAIFSAVGCTEPLVARQPRVAILSTGDELVEPNEKPGPGKIRNSNAWQLMAQVKQAGSIPNYMGIVPDTREDTDMAISKALAENDVVLLTGGVSMGDFDFVPEIMRKNKVDIRFQKVAVKPGRPTVFGVTDKSWIFGLPGNPVSSFINFEVFVKPLLYKLMGNDYKPVEMKMPMGVNFKRKKADRLEWVPVKINENAEVVPVSYHGSAHIHAVCLANALMPVAVGKFEIAKGELVHVRPL
ncbi:MAG: molybdopterin molybdotransferase MoeA [Bacteroidales bacterium]|nr:molybdopterin molybdotransferase MoeA [Bacteroidales bacterium]